MENGIAMESTSLRSLLFHFFIKQRAKGVCLRLVIRILDGTICLRSLLFIGNQPRTVHVFYQRLKFFFLGFAPLNGESRCFPPRSSDCSGINRMKPDPSID